MSSAYVERRETALAGRKALDGAGKRAAFALYYGPLHFLLVQHIVREIGAQFAPGTVVDLGCGTGVAGAAIATSSGADALAEAAVTPPLRVLGFDTHPWTLDEARFTYKAFSLHHDVRRAHAARTRFPADTSVVVAAFVVNELNDADRETLLNEIKAFCTSGSRLPPSRPTGRYGETSPELASRAEAGPAPGSRHVLIVEPISQRISPWWDEWSGAFTRMGGRADLWKARIESPPIVRRLAKASGLRPEMLTARSLFV